MPRGRARMPSGVTERTPPGNLSSRRAGGEKTCKGSRASQSAQSSSATQRLHLQRLLASRRFGASTSRSTPREDFKRPRRVELERLRRHRSRPRGEVQSFWRLHPGPRGHLSELFPAFFGGGSEQNVDEPPCPARATRALWTLRSANVPFLLIKAQHSPK